MRVTVTEFMTLDGMNTNRRPGGGSRPRGRRRGHCLARQVNDQSRVSAARNIASVPWMCGHS